MSEIVKAAKTAAKAVVNAFSFRRFGGMSKTAYRGMLDGYGIASEGTKNTLAWTNPVYAAPQIRTPRTHAPAYTLARDFLAVSDASAETLAKAVEIAKAANPESDARIVEHIGWMLQNPTESPF